MEPNILGTLVLPQDVEIIPCADIADHEVRALGLRSGGYAVTRARSRSPSTLIDADAAELLLLFRRPMPIIDAIIRYSRRQGRDPDRTLRDALPMLVEYFDDRILVSADSPDARPVLPQIAVGTEVSGAEVLSCVNLLEDVEVYHARNATGAAVAVKVARAGHSSAVSRALEREAMILRHLDGASTPRLLLAGRFEGRPHLVMEWCEGVSVARAAEELRDEWSSIANRRLLELCTRVAEAFAALHARGVIHGDVHHQNVLVDARGRVTLLDFGLARQVGAGRLLDHKERGGVFALLDPEFAAARLARRAPPRATVASDQYALGAVLYNLLTGASHLRLSPENDDALLEIASGTPLPFAARGVRPWPEVEEILRVALALDPRERFATVGELARRLRHVPRMTPRLRGVNRRSATARAGRRSIEDTIVVRLSDGGDLFRDGLPVPPTSTVNSGAAGVAYALYRLAQLRGDPALLALADHWGTRAIDEIEQPDAVYDSGGEVSRRSVGRVALYHTASGVHCVRALIAHAAADMATARNSVVAFADHASAGTRNIDLTLGLSGIALGCALMNHAAPRAIPAVGGRLARLADSCLERVWRSLEPEPAIKHGGRHPTLGMAHGWAGWLYATLRWRLVRRQSIEAVVVQRLHELADLAEYHGRGARWPWRLDRRDGGAEAYYAGWCNGSAGLAHLWLSAYVALGDRRFLELGERAAWHAWELPSTVGTDLCCGLGGRAYALLAAYRATGDAHWSRRATLLFDRAVRQIDMSAPRAHALYKGHLGLALLGAELSQPGLARMPLFEDEGWPT